MADLKEKCASLMAQLTSLVLGGDSKLFAELEQLVAKQAAEAQRELPTFMHLKLGVMKSAEQFLNVFAFLVNKAGDWAKLVLNKISFTQEEVELELVKVSVHELTSKEQPTWAEIRDAALGSKFGLQLCPPDVGPALRAAYQNQPDGQILYVGMEPIVLDGDHRLFFVERCGDVRWLCADYYGHPANVWDGDDMFVFVRPRKAS